MMNFRNKSVTAHSFSMVSRPDVPRGRFKMMSGHKTTFNASFLVPVFCEEVLPGDTFSVKMTAFARLATPIFPLMDNLYLDSFFFFVPNRLVWSNWQRFMGERDPNPDSSIDFLIPQVVSPTGGFPVGSVFDYFGLPTVGQVGASNTVSVNALPLRGYNLIYNEWFRDENLINSATVLKNDGPDPQSNYVLRRRGKRYDYFTGCLPWPQKGASVSLPLSGTAPVVTGATRPFVSGQSPMVFRRTDGSAITSGMQALAVNLGGDLATATGTPAIQHLLYPSNLVADLSQATATTINALRQSFQIQRLLERDARGGTRYTEIVRSHFGVVSPDARLQRPEFLGGGSAPVVLNPIAQTSATTITGSGTPLGNLAAIGTALGRHGFSQAFTEHGYVIGMVNVRADLSYQQGLRRMWSRRTRYDFYFPAFAFLGEQAVLSKEIFCDGSAADDNVFGYQERWAEYRHSPPKITGLFRSTSAGTLDAWHLSQRFAIRPTLGQTFIEEDVPLQRVLAVGAGANGAQIIFDSVFEINAARPLPVFSAPGLIDHF